MKIPFNDVDERTFITKYLEFCNLMAPDKKALVPTEILLLVEFILLPDDKFQYQRFSSLAKNKVMAAYASQGKRITKLNINNKILSIVDKGFLRRDEDKVIQLPKHVTKALQEFRKNKSYTITVIYGGK